MFVQGLDHFNIWTNNVDAIRHFYCGIIGLIEGPRPTLPFDGLWLYCGERAIVHVNVGAQTPNPDTGAIDHVAFQGVGDPHVLTARLDREGVKNTFRTLANGVRQVFCADPHGVRVEFNFPPG